MRHKDKLADTAIRNAKPADKPMRMFDGGGLYVEISPAGGKLWRFKYRFGGKEKLLSLGAYPAVSLKDARERREEARKMLANGKDPGAVKQAQKAAIKAAAENNFEAVAREWHSVRKSGWSESHSCKVIARLGKDVFPMLGGVPVSEVNAPKVLAVLRKIEARGAIETAHKAKESISMVMRYAIAKGLAERDPCPDLRGALKPVQTKNMAAIIDRVKVGELLRAMDQYSGSVIVRAALALAPLVFVRPGELRAARWADIDLDCAEWRYTASKTKTRHLVPLARQAVEILRNLQPLTGGAELVFPGERHGRAISDMTLNRALQSMGYNTQTEHTMHGFRAMARTLIAEELHFPPEVIEHQLAHKVSGPLGPAYDRTKFLPQRKKMMREWADYLDTLKRGAEIIPLPKAG
ncbi:MAG: integrase arm-type DNA-binding domain-containing protein [Betaproteobacteria bacterium]|nr:integrase arm-type DNA-binding domain-containing protein [Betaproteobacteria bacterium]